LQEAFGNLARNCLDPEVLGVLVLVAPCGLGAT
jgi:hypothetical protein